MAVATKKVSTETKAVPSVKVKYFSNEIPKLDFVEGKKSNWIDLYSAENVTLQKGEYRAIKLGVGMILPEGHEAHIVPRSSTFKNYGIIQTNHMGVIDNSYCGENDQWHMPVYATRPTFIAKGDRICQFRIVESMPRVKIETVDHLKAESRGGLGSTGK